MYSIDIVGLKKVKIVCGADGPHNVYSIDIVDLKKV